ncbi:Hypothetical predicted protein, partial [Pelobates cultripes]
NTCTQLPGFTYPSLKPGGMELHIAVLHPGGRSIGTGPPRPNYWQGLDQLLSHRAANAQDECPALGSLGLAPADHPLLHILAQDWERRMALPYMKQEEIAQHDQHWTWTWTNCSLAHYPVLQRQLTTHSILCLMWSYSQALICMLLLCLLNLCSAG